MFFCFFSSIFCSITIPVGLGIEEHSNDPLASPTNDEGIPARGEEAEEHEYSNNFEGSSKSMEASAILKMVEDALYNGLFTIDVIVADNDSKI